MTFEPFGLVGGVTVGIPPVLVIDSNGNVTSNRGNIANLSTAVITSSGNITAPFFIGNIVGNVSGNFVVPGTNTSVIFNQAGNAGASDNLQFNYSTNVLSIYTLTVLRMYLRHKRPEVILRYNSIQLDC